jgi:acetyltransferase-like isoleucine patch superfamily enzyme
MDNTTKTLLDRIDPPLRHPSSHVLEPVVILRPEKISIGERSRIDSFVKIEGGEGVHIGAYVHIASFCHLNIGGGTLIMEDGSSAGSGARILSGSALLGHPSCSATHPDVKNVKGTTVIGKGATVFAGATVSPGCTMGERSALGGGSFLRPHTTVPAGELWAGVPAVFKKKIPMWEVL